jgi:hypothetical protein
MPKLLRFASAEKVVGAHRRNNRAAQYNARVGESLSLEASLDVSWSHMLPGILSFILFLFNFRRRRLNAAWQRDKMTSITIRRTCADARGEHERSDVADSAGPTGPTGPKEPKEPTGPRHSSHVRRVPLSISEYYVYNMCIKIMKLNERVERK